MSEPQSSDFCDACSKPIRPHQRIGVRNGRRLHLRCQVGTALLHSVELQDASRELGQRSAALQARTRRILAEVARQLPCPVCAKSLASADAVIFQGSRLVHARCWSGAGLVTRRCASCGAVLGAYESVAYEGRTAYHVRCWAALFRPHSEAAGEVPAAP